MHEEAWEEDGPNMKLARAFIVVLILHIVAVAGLAAFNLLDDGEPKIGSETQLPEEASPPSVEPQVQAEGNGAAAANLNAVVMEGMRPIQVERTMSTEQIARDYGLTEDALIEMNRRIPLAKGLVLPSETIYVPESAERRVPIDELPVAEVVDQPPVQTREEPTETRPPAVAQTKPKEEAKTKTVVKAEPVRPKPSTARASTTTASSHTVRRGETLYSIHRRYGVSVKALQEANGISDPSLIKVDEVLKIPRS